MQSRISKGMGSSDLGAWGFPRVVKEKLQNFKRIGMCVFKPWRPEWEIMEYGKHIASGSCRRGTRRHTLAADQKLSAEKGHMGPGGYIMTCKGNLSHISQG